MPLSQHLAVLSCIQPCTWCVAVEYLHIFKKILLTHLRSAWNCSNIFIPVLFPFTLTLLRMKNTIIPLYRAAFIVDCFMSVRIHFLLNLSSFTQGHTLLCICIPRLFKTRACLSLWLLTWPKMWSECHSVFWLMPALHLSEKLCYSVHKTLWRHY